MKEFKVGDQVPIKHADGTREEGWQIFTIDVERAMAIVTKEVGIDIESQKVPLSGLE